MEWDILGRSIELAGGAVGLGWLECPVLEIHVRLRTATESRASEIEIRLIRHGEFLTGHLLLLAHTDAEGLHFAVKVAAFEAKQLCGVADVAAGFFDLLEDVLALISVACLLQS
jgi:hypothetical protein